MDDEHSVKYWLPWPKRPPFLAQRARRRRLELLKPPLGAVEFAAEDRDQLGVRAQHSD
jgi:hypothetical protein